MKKVLLDLLICPACLPDEIKLKETIKDISGADILAGKLNCPQCARSYPIENGVANLDPNASSGRGSSENKYETTPVVST